MKFHLHPLRFAFTARESIHFPPGKSANLLRGAFGLIFRRLACIPQCREARTCEIASTCPYARLFEPVALDRGPSGFSDWPRPFVFRATHLDGRMIAAGEKFSFDLNLFDLRTNAIAYLVLAFAELSRAGLGPGRRRADLVQVSQRNEYGDPSPLIYDGKAFVPEASAVAPMAISLLTPPEPTHQVRVRFLTPIELKSGQQLAARPDFGVVAGRIRDRISKLRELYGNGPLEIDFRAFGDRAAAIQMTRCEIHHVDVERTSSRTGQHHSIGGFVGEADYEGDLTEFVPYLRAAKWTGVGRQTVWGKGEIEMSVL